MPVVEEGVLNVIEVNTTEWHFSGAALRRARLALRLERDLELNLAGVALALELMDELEALRRANLPCEVVPGISAAMAATAAAGISLTDRRAASQVLFSTFSRSPERGNREWSQLTADTTLVVYMPGTNYREVADRLHDSGLPDDLPCVIVSRASTAQQQIRWSTVGSLAFEEKLPAPALFIVGRVASHNIAEISQSFWTAREQDSSRPIESIV